MGAGSEAGKAAANTEADDSYPPPPMEQEQWLCIITFDEIQLYLPDGRVPREVLTGPLGLYFICG